jgi:hypothetical protein
MIAHNSDFYRCMAEWAERKADDAAGSDAPWALKNLRLYQNIASEWWRKHYLALHAEELERSIAFQEAGEE